jgi:hypothetical protein
MEWVIRIRGAGLDESGSLGIGDAGHGGVGHFALDAGTVGREDFIGAIGERAFGVDVDITAEHAAGFIFEGEEEAVAQGADGDECGDAGHDGSREEEEAAPGFAAVAPCHAPAPGREEREENTHGWRKGIGGRWAGAGREARTGEGAGK